MSGIYGIYRYDGAPVDPQWMERMRAAMAYYGPDGGGCKIDGPVGMGHLLLAVNPEDTFEKQPIQGERGLVVCTARLDNRDALLETFRIRSTEAPQVSDGRLVSLAFDKWGEEVCTHLEGDWALAAWDAKERRLYLGRDVIGAATLYYHERKGFIAFASNLKALLALPGVNREPDWMNLAQILVIWQNRAELTAYKDFRRLVWAHALTVECDGRRRIRAYWSSEHREPYHFRRDEDYVEGFLEHYEAAVRSCLRTRRNVAATLSAGRDSGSVVRLAAPILADQGRELNAFTAVPFLAPDGATEKHLGNEWNLSSETARFAGANVKHLAIDARNYGVLRSIEHVLDAHNGPSQAAGNHYWIHAIMDAASQSGSRVLLTAQLGNGTVSWPGSGCALLAVLHGEIATACRLLRAEPSLWKAIKRQILKPPVMLGKRALRNLTTRARDQWRAYSALNPQAVENHDLELRMHRSNYDPSLGFSPLMDNRRLILAPDFGNGFGIWPDLAAKRSLSCLDPTTNLALVEFLLRVPDDQFYRGGRTSVLFNRSFNGRLSESILDGSQKGLQAADLGNRIIRELSVVEECLSALDSCPGARYILDLDYMRSSLKELCRQVNPETTSNASAILLRGLSVGLFLIHFNSEGVCLC